MKYVFGKHMFANQQRRYLVDGWLPFTGGTVLILHNQTWIKVRIWWTQRRRDFCFGTAGFGRYFSFDRLGRLRSGNVEFIVRVVECRYDGDVAEIFGKFGHKTFTSLFSDGRFVEHGSIAQMRCVGSIAKCRS